MAEPSASRAFPRRFGVLPLALLLCAVLSLGWIAAGWRELAMLHLPDPDDTMRLVQVRDWLGGQPWRDLTQHRLGPSGVPMHWSRLGDLGPAALMLALRPLLGGSAELAAVLLWPAMLFLAFLLLCGRIACRLGAPADAPVAVVLAALAWPATWIFMPGRIDHHGLQIVLLLTAVHALLREPSWRSGATLGLATAASLALGLETAPQLALALAATIWLWIANPSAERGRMAAAGGALLAGIGTAALAHPSIWPADLCDAFTPQVAQAAAIGGGALVLAAAVPPRLRHRQRLALLAGIAVLSASLILLAAPGCLAGPYAAVDPQLRALWLDHVEEAQGILQTDLGIVIGYLGVAVAGLLAALWFARAKASRGWSMLAALLTSAVLVACVQLRAAHVAAALAPPALAHLVGHARRAGLARRLGAWLASFGLVYQLVGQAVAGERVEAPTPLCDIDRGMAALQALPPGMVLAPIDLGPRILADSRHRVLAAPYHRNAAGNLPALRHQLGLARDPHSSGADYQLDCAQVHVLKQPERP
jgi:uncharacterized membrane protein YeaQ/YmgE (transglycosylase-associated protein family)